uniref:Uncharacterized protein n=1 Tax=Candidatus Aramenus sulfurataquae TaxID=1326980 RepID=A0AAE3K1R2_9CREN|nr:hypothetical protein [Candidatus Aramenus sulfurataquae]
MSYKAMERLRGQGNYSVVETDNEVTITYYPPSPSEAFSEEEVVREIRIVGVKRKDYVEIEKAVVVENGREVKKMSESELSLWLDYIEGM